MKYTLRITFAAAAIASIACSHREAKPAAGAPAATTGAAPAAWAAKMQSLSIALSDLLPLVASPTKFAADENQTRIETDVKTFRALAHSLGTKEAPAPNGDPAMTMVGELFEEDVDRALESFRSGNKERARAILRDAAGYCIGCHTQTANGPSYPRLALDVKVKDLPRMERAEFNAATRQFDAAVEEFEAVLKEPLRDQNDAFAWERAARSALAIIVRVQKSPTKGLELVDIIQRNKRAPADVPKQAAFWAKQLKEWKKEKDTAPGDRMARAETMIARAQAAQAFPLDHTQDVLWFRAGALLHELLSEQPVARDTAPAATTVSSALPSPVPSPVLLQARALFLAGLAAEATRDMNFWTLHETYFELCIKRDAHGAQASKCFDRLNDSVTMGYSGSAGTMIPPDVRKRLEMLRTLAAERERPSVD